MIKCPQCESLNINQLPYQYPDVDYTEWKCGSCLEQFKVSGRGVENFIDPMKALLATRGSSHGEFRENSTTAQVIKSTMRRSKNWEKLQPFQQEALDMIAHKIGRIFSGDPHFLDHWEDIAGYAKLAADRVREDSNAS